MSTDRDLIRRTALTLADLGHSIEAITSNPLIPENMREYVRELLAKDEEFVLTPARTLTSRTSKDNWLADLDRTDWTYWPALRQFLLTRKGWARSAVRALDDSSDRVLRELPSPVTSEFDCRGLVLGFVQSGKTANYTAVLSKAADAGYRLFIVLSGLDNGLRRQTNHRLKHELVGFSDSRPSAVPLPPMGKQWHEFTNASMDGDFRPGFANQAALQGSQPVLLVVKKNGTVLRRLIAWLEDAPKGVRARLPMLMIDDEADQGSVDTSGGQPSADASGEQEVEEPSKINGLIRDLLLKFDRRAYVAYTATPFANILIPHDVVDPRVGNDLYPRDFIVDLPKPIGYFGAEEIFGRLDVSDGSTVGGLDVIREVPDTDIASIDSGAVPESLKSAIVAFALAGAARLARGDGNAPATMLVHTSSRIADQAHLCRLIDILFSELRDEWRYQRRLGIRERMHSLWESEFRPVTRASHLDRDMPFQSLEDHIGPFLELVQVKEINSDTGDVLDYDREPALKAIAVGGNRLSRGLTLEGLLVSYFVRRSATYDTLMQMGRWFGFRSGYEDLTRIYTTRELAGWFSDLAFVEYQLRKDIEVYEEQGLLPIEVGMRIWQHPTMQVTSRLKRRFASETLISQSYSGHLEQTFKWPFRRTPDLIRIAESNKASVRKLVTELGTVTMVRPTGPLWADVPAARVVDFLLGFETDDDVRSISLPLIVEYIQRSNLRGELKHWIVAVSGRGNQDAKLGTADWSLPTGPIAQVSRSRLRHTESVGVIVDPADEAIGLETTERGSKARLLRSPEEGLLILYPISRNSGSGLDPTGSGRHPLFESEGRADLVGLAISFPPSPQPEVVEAYLEGTVRWRPVE